MFETIITFLIIAVTLAVLGYGLYIYLRNKSLAEIRTDVYQLFLKAEHNFKYTGAGQQKMKWVVQKARSLLPAMVQAFVTEEFLYKVIQAWFDAIKDLLDDGRLNASVEEENEDQQ